MSAEGRRRPGGGQGVRVALSLAIALAFAAFVQWYAGWAELLRPWRSVPAGALALAAGLMLLTHALRAMRVHDYFGEAVAGQRLACMQLVLRHNLFNNLLPMRSGELAFPVLMWRGFGVAPSVSLPGLLWFRLLDLHALLLFAAPVLALVLHPGLVVLAVLAWLPLPWLAYRAGRRASIAIAGRVSGRPGLLLARAFEGLPRTDPVFWRAQGWTLANWALKLTVFIWVLSQFAPLGVAYALLGALGGELTSVLPIHGAGGFGTYEAGVVALTLASGVAPEQLLRAAVNLHLFVLGITLIAGGVASLPLRTGSGRDHRAEGRES